MLHFMWDISLGIQYKLNSDTNLIKENTLGGATSYPSARQKSWKYSEIWTWLPDTLEIFDFGIKNVALGHCLSTSG